VTGPNDTLDVAVNSPVDPSPIHEEDEDEDPTDQPEEAPDTEDDDE
jgi:hypothetical protein